MKKLIKVHRSFIEFDRGHGQTGIFLHHHTKQRCHGCGSITQVLAFDGGETNSPYWTLDAGWICQECITALFADTYRSESYEEDKYF